MGFFRRQTPSKQQDEEAPRGLGAFPSARPAPSHREPFHLSEPYVSLKNGVEAQYVSRQPGGTAPDAALLDRRRLGAEIGELLDRAATAQSLALDAGQREELIDQTCAEIAGYGPIEAFLHDDSVSEIMVNGPKAVYVERGGRLQETSVSFLDADHVARTIRRIVAPLGRRIDESSPMVDGRLPDGSRVNAVIPPLAVDGPTINIRKFARVPFSAEDLIAQGTMSPELVQFLEGCVRARLNIIISGGTGTGKTTLLNVVSGYLPSSERIITIEDAAELQLRQRHVVRLEAKPPDIDGRGQVTIRQLVINALRMRPDRMVIGEARGGEALDMLQAMNTGHDGSMTTVHSSSPRDTLRRIETMVLMAGIDLPLRAIREQIAAAIDLIVHLQRMPDGARRVVQVTEVQGMEGETIVVQDVFAYRQAAGDGGRAAGRLLPTGIRPAFTRKLEAAGVFLPADLFVSPGGPLR